jgi:hypothetical protein
MPQVIAGAILAAEGIAATSATGIAITIGVDLAFAVAATELSKALAPKQTTSQATGINGSSTIGEGVPEGFILGKFATNGWAACPDLTHGSSGGTPNAYLTQVRELSGIAGTTLSRVAINGKWATLGADDGSGYGQPMQGDYAGYGWVKFYDGTQTAADPGMITNYGSDPNYPWDSTMIGTGICYAICTFRFNRNLFSSAPQVTFELQGAKLYDPRYDSTVGGSGSQLWSDPTTWAATDNPMVMAYNILRGITVGADTWGGECAAADLDLSNWFAAMNACDATVTNGDSTTEAAYRAGYYVTVDMHPADVLDTLKSAAAAEFAEIGGTFKARVGGPGSPAYVFTDDDLVITDPDQLTPFPGLDKTYNAINASYPAPDSIYQTKAAPVRTDSTYQTADGSRYLSADLKLPACPYPNQVQRLQLALLQDDRRFRQHQLTLPPDAAILEPLDSVSWTSSENGYTSKVFEAAKIVDDQTTILQTVSLRERDSGDYTWSSTDQIAQTAPSVAGGLLPAAQAIAAWAVTGITVPDSLGLRDLSAIKVTWNDPGSDDVQAILIEVEDNAGTLISSSRYDNVANGFAVITDGIIGGNTYSARGKIVPYSGRGTTWSSWLSATAPAVTYPATSPAPGFWASVTALEAAAATGGILPVATLPAAGSFDGQIILLLPSIQLYRWDAATSAWSTDLYAVPAPSSVDAQKFASGLTPVEIVSTLPTTGNFTGRMAVLTTDGKLYRYNGGWTAAVASSDISGTLTDAQIASLAASKITGTLADSQLAAIAAAKVTGTIGATQIADNAISTAKLAAGSVTASQISASTITASQMAASSITATQLAAGSVTTSKVAAGAITSSLIAANTITAGNIAAGTITSSLIAANTITAGQIAAGTITATQLAAGSVTASQIAAGAVITSKIAAGAITASEISAAAITVDKLAAGAVTIDKLASDLQTANYTPGGAAGFLLSQAGTSYFNAPVITRQLQVDSGTFSIGSLSFAENTNFAQVYEDFIETNILASAWSGTTKTYVAACGTSGTLSTNSSDFPNVQWGATVTPMPVTKWTGNAKIFLHLRFFARNAYQVTGWAFDWRVYEVT